MRSDADEVTHPWDGRLGELTLSGRTVGYVRFSASLSGVEWTPAKWWRLSKASDWWIEVEEWFVRPGGEMASFAGHNMGTEAEFASLDEGKFTAALWRLDSDASREPGAPDEVDVDFRWATDEERDHLLTRLLEL